MNDVYLDHEKKCLHFLLALLLDKNVLTEEISTYSVDYTARHKYIS